jgi:hypothetical protein
MEPSYEHVCMKKVAITDPVFYQFHFQFVLRLILCKHTAPENETFNIEYTYSIGKKSENLRWQ